MKPALLLVDLQLDFLSRPGLQPEQSALVARAAALLSACRERGIPVLHARTQVRADGSDRMPHWVRADHVACVTGTPGAEPPPQLAALANEPVFGKRFFSAFEDARLAPYLRERKADTLVVAGVYLHGCVRATALDAYAAGLKVLVAADAVGSTEPLHATISREYLDGRAARFLDSPALLEELVGRRAKPDSTLAQAAAAAAKAGEAWRGIETSARARVLRNWREILVRDSETLAALLASEIGKPLADGRAELKRAAAHIDTAIRVAAENPAGPRGVLVRYRPIGCIALITPWNNPVAIAAGKIAPALAFGNTVVWKPSPLAPLTSLALMQSLIAAELPPGVVTPVFGDADTARALIREPGIAAVSITGSQRTGQDAAALCALLGKPIQAELGGNNAAIVLADADLDASAAALARSAFSFAGQRCTAIRRFIVEAQIAAPFERALATATRALRVGDPRREDTDVGPLITPERRAEVAEAIERAIAAGARLVAGGATPKGRPADRWLEPTLLADVGSDAAIARQETFGPVAIIQHARDLDGALALANGVPQGLVGGLVGGNAKQRQHFAAQMQAGILQYGAGPVPIHAEAPFGGWKSSGLGPAEHGRWDREFYARPQAIYGEARGS